MTLNKRQKQLIKEINKLKKKKNAILLVHNYQRPEIYEVADYLGDSLELAKKAQETDADIILFCGVDFMAESAKVLNPEKKVLLPVLAARCPMAGMVDIQKLEEIKRKNPDAAVACYINTTAETKAACDVTVTSANAVKIIAKLPQKKIIFVPDKNLADYVKLKTGKEIIPWDGYCYVHNKMQVSQLAEAKKEHPQAKVIAHPECPPEIIALADYVCSTSEMMTVAREDPAKEFIIGTEIGMIERLKIVVPEKVFYSLPPAHTCLQMKKNTLESIKIALEQEKNEVFVDDKVAAGAKEALQKMIDLS